jgi:hypothetical protein
MSKKSKVWALVLAVITGGIAVTAYAFSPSVEAALTQN